MLVDKGTDLVGDRVAEGKTLAMMEVRKREV